jgi:Sensors of blue-light using FAD
MNLIQLIYASRPFGFDNATLNAILIEARRSNPRHEITGALICRADIYLQLLEGPETAVDSTFARIARDDRHLEVKVLYRMPAENRLFPEWAMRDDPARSWMWTKREVIDGALLRASPEDILKVFERLVAEPD